MRLIVISLTTILVATNVHAAAPPVVEKYLFNGELNQGEQALELILATAPKNAQARFGLGVLQFVRSIEHFGQALFEYGCKNETNRAPFLRVPVPQNEQPSPISYAAFRRMFDLLHRDLASTEATLAKVDDDSVSLPLRLADVHVDLDGDGKATDKFSDILKKVMGQNFEFLAKDPKFLVHFDRGDVAWLRAYCHLLMSMIDFYLAFDTEDFFDEWSKEAFAKPLIRKRVKQGDPAPGNVIAMQEPARLGRFRKHVLEVCVLNKETWKHIRAEKDDDHEWLPNAKQKGVIGLPVRDEMIDAWLDMMSELEDLFNGKKVIPVMVVKWLWPHLDHGLNIKLLLDDPPERFDFDLIQKRGPRGKYLDKNAKELNINTLFRAFQIFENPMTFAYAAWFN